MPSWSTDPRDDRPISAADLGKECVHCHCRCGNFVAGYATIAGAALCHPNVAGRPDCYLNVIRDGHPLHDCADCREIDPAPLPIKPGRLANRSRFTDGLRIYT